MPGPGSDVRHTPSWRRLQKTPNHGRAWSATRLPLGPCRLPVTKSRSRTGCGPGTGSGSREHARGRRGRSSGRGGRIHGEIGISIQALRQLVQIVLVATEVAADHAELRDTGRASGPGPPGSLPSRGRRHGRTCATADCSNSTGTPGSWRPAAATLRLARRDGRSTSGPPGRSPRRSAAGSGRPARDKRPTFDWIAMPMFFQIFTPIAPSSNVRRSRAIVRSVNPDSSKPRASNVDAQASAPPLRADHLRRL